MSTDRISELPNPILNMILSSLHSTEEAVRTSILSTRWRYVWTSTPSLDIDIMRRPKALDKITPEKPFKKNKNTIPEKPFKKKKNITPEQEREKERQKERAKEREKEREKKREKKREKEREIERVINFREFVYWVLANGSTLYLDSFSLDFGNHNLDHSDMLTIEQWIHIAVTRKVKHLAFFTGGEYGAIMLPRSVDYDSLQMLKSDLYEHSLEYQTMKISNGSKALITNNDVDHISSLPDRILHMILSRVNSTERVVQTSVLSTRWRYLWTSVQSLDISIWRGPRSVKFKEFVYWVLSNRKVDLDSFTLNSSDYCDISTIERWFHLLVMRKVKQLDLTFDKAILLPRCLVDCDSLEVLKLNLLRYPLNLIRFTGSKTLKVLHLFNVKLLDRKMVRKFLINCPLLEELYLLDCITYNLKSLVIPCLNLKNLRINNQGLSKTTREIYEKERLCEKLMIVCPKLVYLAYEGHMANHFAFNVKSLKKAVIKLEDMKQNDQTYDSFGVTIWELFAQVSHVEFLSINYLFFQSISFTRGFSNCLEEDFPQSLPNLKTLELTIDCYSKDRLLRILKCFPNLETLHLIIYKDISPKELETFVEKLDEVETRKILTRHLKKVEFLKYNGERETLAIARFLLEHGSALEKLVFSWNSKEEKCHKLLMEAMDEVSKFYKASLSVKVINLFILENQ